ncbi:relaxase domain-containing protein [Auritidibacter sp. NML130574]|nr:relaxase domain-containing protein [Auritidibacter sp. NML130574]
MRGAKLGHTYPTLSPPRERIAALVAIQDIRDEEIVRKSRTAIAGFDLTFSPPNSLSALWGVADTPAQELVAQAHHAVTRDTVALLEERVVSTQSARAGPRRCHLPGHRHRVRPLRLKSRRPVVSHPSGRLEQGSRRRWEVAEPGLAAAA